MAGKILFSPGTVITWQKYDTSTDPWTLSGSPVEFKGVKSFTAPKRLRTVAEVTTLMDTTIERAPVKYDLGSITLTFNQLTDEEGTNECVKLNEAWENGDILNIVIDRPGDWDKITAPAKTNANQLAYSGFINSISDTDLAVNDDPLTYTVEITLVLPHILPGT